eukprot:scaffold50510_cov54-Phaeocystis_antarctica.AAC.1
MGGAAHVVSSITAAHDCLVRHGAADPHDGWHAQGRAQLPAAAHPRAPRLHRHMHGMCMAYAWHMHGICMVYATHPRRAPRLHRCAHDPLRHRHILPASRARLGMPTAHGARLVFRLGAQDPHNSNPNPNPNPNPKP